VELGTVPNEAEELPMVRERASAPRAGGPRPALNKAKRRQRNADVRF